MTAHIPEPYAVVYLVENYADAELTAIGKYPKQRQAFDQDGMYGLHDLAAEIYAQGHHDGRMVEGERDRRRRQRDRDRDAE